MRAAGFSAWAFVLFTAGSTQPAGASDVDFAAVFAKGITFSQFLSTAVAQRQLWLRNATTGAVPQELVARLTRSSAGLRFLIVAEDWCPDSVNTVPYVAKLADAAHVELRIVGRAVGAGAMDAHRTADGRTATPTIVLLRNGRDAGAWVERPLILQQSFRAMAADPQAARQFANRQAWYDADGGRTTLAEVVALTEQTAR